jgi:hypothetical protein
MSLTGLSIIGWPFDKMLSYEDTGIIHCFWQDGHSAAAIVKAFLVSEDILLNNLWPLPVLP